MLLYDWGTGGGYSTGWKIGIAFISFSGLNTFYVFAMPKLADLEGPV